MIPFWLLEDYHEGKPLVVCGNGPSLQDVPPELFEKYPTMACNSVYARGYFNEHTPDWYVIEGLGHLKKPDERASRVPYLIKVAQNGGHSLVNRRMAHHFQHLENIYYVDYIDLYGQAFQSFQFDPFLNYGTGHCVGYAMLQFAYYLTSGPVLLVGYDHSFKNDQWHFFPDEDVPAFVTMPKDNYIKFREKVDPKFEEAAEVFRVTKRTLLNLTPDSKADMFTRDTIENWL